MEHLKKYMGLYMVAGLSMPLLFPDGEETWLWWLLIATVVCLAPPFNLKDRFVNVLGTFFMFLLRPFHRWQGTWPKWVKVVFAIVVLVLFEEYFLQSLGQTMYPWRMDFSN
tara:strand:- start:387 stop:719 length:333 start_codon:yes stop_codon:yes gene_type:complete